jgi:hypothetical protein
MPPKRKTAATLPAGPAPKRASTRARQPRRRPGDDNAGPPLPPAGRGNSTAPAHPNEARLDEVEERLAELDTTLQANTQQLNDMATVLNDIRERMDPDRPTVPIATLTGNDPPVVPDGILSRWPWVDRSLAEDISNGNFNIYDLPKLHRDEYLRNKHIAKSVDGVIHPLTGGRPYVVQAKTKLQSSLKDFGTFLSAWMVYVSVRTTFEPERGPGLAIWTERVAFLSTLQYEFASIVSYVIAYFQAHQNNSPEAWFLVDSELHSEHFGNAAQRTLNTIRSQPAKPLIKAPSYRPLTLIPITEEVCRNWNRSSGCKGKDQTPNTCLRRHVCLKCEESGHTEHNCTKRRPT